MLQRSCSQERDEQSTNTFTGFVTTSPALTRYQQGRGIAHFNRQGIECRRVTSENGSTDVPQAFAKAPQALGLRHIRTRPYTPRTSGAFIQT